MILLMKDGTSLLAFNLLPKAVVLTNGKVCAKKRWASDMLEGVL
jgi:hypothetical protein